MSNQEMTAVEAKKGIEGVILSKAFLSRIQQVAASTISPERLARVFLATTTINPTLLKCSRESIALSLMRCAVVGLEPDGIMGEAYLVPYWDNNSKSYQAQYQPGFKGLCKLARQSGEVADIWAEVVYEGDEFEEEKGLTPKLTHKPSKLVNRGALVAAYAVCRFRDGSTRARVVYEDEINKVKDQIRRRSRDKKSLTTPWSEHEPEMWKKTAIIRLCKTLPASVAKAVERADADESGGDILDGSFTVTGTKQPVTPDAPPPQVSDDHPTLEPLGQEGLDAVFTRYLQTLNSAATVKAAGEAYDAYFGPESAHHWDDSQQHAGTAAYNERKELVRNK